MDSSRTLRLGWAGLTSAHSQECVAVQSGRSQASQGEAMKRKEPCPECGMTDDNPNCHRKDCPYRCDPVLDSWDAELVETEGSQFPESQP